MVPTDDAKDLVVEIFRQTGLKVDADDPIVIAALYQASLIQGAGQKTAANIAAQTEKLEKASQGIMQHLQELVRTSGAVASAKMKEARESEESELRRSVAGTIETAINNAVGKAVGDGVNRLNESAGNAVSRLNEALSALEVAAARSEQKVAQAVKTAQPGWSKLIAGVVVMSSVLGGLVGFLASRTL